MPGPRITIVGRQPDVFRLAAKLTRPEDGLRPWRALGAYFEPGKARMEFVPTGRHWGDFVPRVISLDDFCADCRYAPGKCSGQGVPANARACADVEISRLRRQVEAEANPVRFVYHPPVYGEEDVNYLTAG